MVLQGGEGTVGITQHAQEEISDAVFVELPTVGRRVAAGDEAAVVESVKAAFSIYAPVAGTISRVNARLTQTPALVNTAPHAEGWIFALRPDAPSEWETLMTRDQYQAWLAQEPPPGGLHPEHP